MTRETRQAASADVETRRGSNQKQNQDNTEPETSTQPPDGEQESLKRELANVYQLLKASTTGLIALDKTGLIRRVNQSAVDLLGAEESYLLNKPVSLFIALDDQATFYLNRSRIVSGNLKTPFEIKLRRRDGSLLWVRVNAQPIASPGHALPGMLLAVDDITAYREALDRLQFKEDFAGLLFSTLDDLATWSATDIDEIIIYALEKIGIVSGADRVYVCLFHEKRTRLSITHEWIGDKIVSPTLHNQPVGRFRDVLKKIKNQTAACVADINRLSSNEQANHAAFHATGVKSFFFLPLGYGRKVLGMIGCDAVRRSVSWSKETQQLVKCIGAAIIHALVRRQTERASAEVQQSIVQLVDPPSPLADASVPEYDGPIEIVDEADAAPDPTDPDWRFEAQGTDEPQPSEILLLKDGKTASLACGHCNRQRQLDISEIRILGTQLKATCVCGKVKTVKVELRREHRKSVKLKGVFLRGPGDRLALKSDDWGHIEIYNLSRRGIGFEVVGKADMRVDDRFRVNFTLDNTAGSIIQKEVRVRSVVGKMVGCQFEGQDACDVTLGFYLMN